MPLQRNSSTLITIVHQIIHALMHVLRFSKMFERRCLRAQIILTLFLVSHSRRNVISDVVN